MSFQEIKPMKKDGKGAIYSILPEDVPIEKLDDVRFIKRRLGTISGDGHDHPYTEMFYLMSGTAMVTINGETRGINTPHLMIAYPHQEHVFEAATNIMLVEYIFRE